jgi:riboflavin synthase
MFTGLIEALGVVREAIPTGAGRDLFIEASAIAGELALGESVAVNGCCLTVVAHDSQTCRFQAGPETLRRTNLGDLRPDNPVNLERSLRVGDRLGESTACFLMATGFCSGSLARRSWRRKW